MAPCLASLFVPLLVAEKMLPGTANTSRPCSSAQSAVMSEPLLAAASTTTTPRARPLMRRLRTGKKRGCGSAPGQYSEMIAPCSAMAASSLPFSGG